MVMVIINPGTESDDSATVSNATKVAEYICEDLGRDPGSFTRAPARDCDGWFGFDFPHNGRVIEVDIPGDDPDTVREGKPFRSRRLYVNGSSWLYGFALNRFSDDE